MTHLSTRLILDCDSSNENNIEIFKNDENKIYIGNDELMPGNFYFAIDKEDWISIKNFIDDQFQD